tara:strand:+ start:323 stop:1066 length:744 start_codon:yes stop_codon:yes gene_type:complete
MRNKIVAGNWKMNLSVKEGVELVNALKEMNLANEVQTIVIPPFTHLYAVSQKLEGSEIKVGSQNNHQAEEGAFTGEVSAKMLKQIGVEYGLVGHSERRTYFHEDNLILKSKLDALLKNNIKAIFCCGESLEERKSGQHFNTVRDQLSVLWDLSSTDFQQIIIAYEPVWAIGTGETASSDQAQEMHEFIRSEVKQHFGDLADSTSILYGGSCKPGNAQELFAQKDVDGGLIGGASLNATDFAAIINAF